MDDQLLLQEQAPTGTYDQAKQVARQLMSHDTLGVAPIDQLIEWLSGERLQ